MAKMITARADVESAKLMRDAAEFLNSSTAMQVRYLETIGLLGNAGGTKICFIQDENDKNKLMHNITQGLLA
jgi:erythrocyte band 7 integral membrane protein